MAVKVLQYISDLLMLRITQLVVDPKHNQVRVTPVTEYSF